MLADGHMDVYIGTGDSFYPCICLKFVKFVKNMSELF
jgi:hypothetical protein